jgi:hypothetical protein
MPVRPAEQFRYAAGHLPGFIFRFRNTKEQNRLYTLVESSLPFSTACQPKVVNCPAWKKLVCSHFSGANKQRHHQIVAGKSGFAHHVSENWRLAQPAKSNYWKCHDMFFLCF